MRYTEERYISLLTDFGFKRIFGTNPNKDLLIDFLNSLFDGEQVVKNVTFLNSEHVGDVRTDRKAIFDVYCENEKARSLSLRCRMPVRNTSKTVPYIMPHSLFVSKRKRRSMEL